MFLRMVMRRRSRSRRSVRSKAFLAFAWRLQSEWAGNGSALSGLKCFFRSDVDISVSSCIRVAIYQH
jgi:hypothetical protein